MSKLRKMFCWEVLYALVLVLLCGCIGPEESIEGVPVVGEAADAVEARSQRARIAAGAFHTLAVSKAGTVWSWGINEYGQLGDGSTSTRLAPVQVANLTHIVAVAAGYAHSLALKSDGTVWAWGNNAYGQLGNPNIALDTNVLVPTQVFDNVIAIAANTYHSMAIRSDGKVVTWGINTYGQLGNGTVTMSAAPVNVIKEDGTQLTNVISVSAGSQHSLALMASGEVYAWGSNAFGQLGIGNYAHKLKAVQVSVQAQSGAKLIDLAAGHVHSLALLSDGSVMSWGDNSKGQLGIDSNDASSTPVVVLSQSDVKAIGAGYWHSFALRRDGGVSAWGYNYYGQIGDTTTSDALTPSSVANLSGVTALVGGAYHSIALKVQGVASSWGYNAHGELGSGTTTGRTSPADLVGLALGLPLMVKGGENHTIALHSDGTTWAWGYNGFGQLGVGPNGPVYEAIPLKVLIGPDVVAVASGANHNLALHADGTVSGWGRNQPCGQAGADPIYDQPTPAKIMTAQGTAISGIVAIAAGDSHSLAVTYDGELYAWGCNDHGQLGTGVVGPGSNQPVAVATPYKVTSVGAGINHSLAVTQEGYVLAWGNGESGQLCDGSVGAGHNSPNPLRITGLTQSVGVAGGQHHSLLLSSDGRVRACGGNSDGQLGTGDQVARATPTLLSTPTRVTRIAAGARHSVALKSNGFVFTWGNNDYGQIGDGNVMVDRLTPYQVPSSAFANGVGVAAGAWHTAAARSDGYIYLWGRNALGQIGNDSPDVVIPLPANPVDPPSPHEPF